MREIKFRAWDQQAKDWNDKFSTKGQGVYAKHNPITEMWNDYKIDLSEKRFDIMQYTGLKDRNGVEIYEGDIVNQFDLIVKRQVVYINAAFGYYDSDGPYRQFISFAQNQWYNWDCDKSNDIEVIGNVYENPELLIK